MLWYRLGAALAVAAGLALLTLSVGRLIASRSDRHAPHPFGSDSDAHFSERTAAIADFAADDLAELSFTPLREPDLAGIEPSVIQPPQREPIGYDVYLAAAANPYDSGDVVGITDEPSIAPDAVEPVLHAVGRADMSLRNSDFPRTYICDIEVDLTSPSHWVRLRWAGPQAARQERGPFHSSPGAGLGNNDCNDPAESNRTDSNCTPKGEFSVEMFSDTMRSYPECRHVTWFWASRGIAFHYYPNVPNYPASHGCVRLNARAAQLIHNNSLIGKTRVTVGGTWTRR